MTQGPDPTTHWASWHRDYENPSSPLSQRLGIVVARLREALDTLPPGPVRLLSSCAGQGQDVVGALDDHARSHDVSGRLIEADPHNIEAARRALDSAGLRHIEAVCADASVTDAYADMAPADLLLLCGIFGNVSDPDVRNTVTNSPMLCAPGGFVIWTRHRRTPDLTPQIRDWFETAGFDEVAFDSPGPDSFSVGVARYAGPPAPLVAGVQLFAFLR